MHHQEFKSPDELNSFIKCFWYNKLDSKELATGFEVIPDGYAEIIFYFGEEISISINGVLESLTSPFMVGLLNRPVTFYSKGGLGIIGIRCFPWTIYDLLGLPSGKDGVRTFTHTISQLQSTLNKPVQDGRIEQAIMELNTFFLNEQLRSPANPMLSKAGHAIREAGGAMRISRVAETAHVTVRTLERAFKHFSGFSIKDVSALIRFEQARNQLWLNPTISIAGLAYELGYTDQSHLSRDFKRFAGTTPAAFARKAKKKRDTLSHDFVAFIQDS